MSAMASEITSLKIVYSTIYSGADQRKYQSSASLTFARGIHRWPVNSPHKGPVTRKMFPLDDVIMCNAKRVLMGFQTFAAELIQCRAVCQLFSDWIDACIFYLTFPIFGWNMHNIFAFNGFQLSKISQNWDFFLGFLPFSQKVFYCWTIKLGSQAYQGYFQVYLKYGHVARGGRKFFAWSTTPR